MTGAQRGDTAPAAAVQCTCGPGAWGTCDTCGVDAWIKHHCPFPCDDVTCEDGSACIGCLTGHPCPVHNDTDEDWEEAIDGWKAEIESMPLADLLASFHTVDEETQR